MYHARLQRAQRENISRVRLVGAPVVDDVKDFGADNPAKHGQDAEIPSIIGIHSLALRVAHADPQAHQHSQGNKESVGGQVEITEMKKSWKHLND
jgi:hypothetical protein